MPCASLQRRSAHNQLCDESLNKRGWQFHLSNSKYPSHRGWEQKAPEDKVAKGLQCVASVFACRSPKKWEVPTGIATPTGDCPSGSSRRWLTGWPKSLLYLSPSGTEHSAAIGWLGQTSGQIAYQIATLRPPWVALSALIGVSSQETILYENPYDSKNNNCEHWRRNKPARLTVKLRARML